MGARQISCSAFYQPQWFVRIHPQSSECKMFSKREEILITHYLLSKGDYAFGSVCLFVCLSFCLVVFLIKL